MSLGTIYTTEDASLRESRSGRLSSFFFVVSGVF